MADIAWPTFIAPPLSWPRVANSCSAVRCCTWAATASAERPAARFPSPTAVRPAKAAGSAANRAVRASRPRGGLGSGVTRRTVAPTGSGLRYESDHLASRGPGATPWWRRPARPSDGGPVHAPGAADLRPSAGGQSDPGTRPGAVPGAVAPALPGLAHVLGDSGGGAGTGLLGRLACRPARRGI